MDEMRNKLLNFLENLIKQLVLSPSYNGNIDLFYQNNANLEVLINNSKVITNPDLKRALLTYFNQQDYMR